MLEKRPLVCFTDTDGKFVVLGGNMRLKAAKELKMTELPIMLADDWTEEQKAEFLIKDNVGFGEWNWEELQSDWDSSKLEEWGLEVPEFSVQEELSAEEDDFNAEPPAEPITVLGDLYEIGEHRLLCGDSTDSEQVAKLMNGEKADMVFTDPPYGVSYTGGHNKKQRKGIESDDFQDEDLSNLFQDSINNACIFSKDSSPFYIWYAGGKSKETYLGLSNTPIEVRAVICWYKIKSGSGAFMSQYIPNYEPCIYGFKEGKSINWYGPTDEKTVWEFPKDKENEFHLTQKPIPVVERALKNSSKNNDLIYDCFLGGGSTMVASHQLKRKCYGMELDPKYCDVIVKRMLKLDPTLIVKRNGEIINKELWHDQS
jgi:site-specific DNA-methyltransferase (adenine-specific)